MLVLKLTDEDAAKYGCKTIEDLHKSLANAVASDELLANAAKEAQAMNEKLNAFEARLAALEKQLAETKPASAIATEDRAAIIAEAIEQAGKNMHAFVAKIGTAALPQSQGVESEAINAKLVAPDDYKGQWEADQKLQAEFSSFEVYAAFKAAMDNGRVRIK